MAQELTLHEPFQRLLRPLTDEEKKLLRDKILDDGAIYPIDVDQHGRVIDGYHTLEIYRGEGLSNFPIREHDFGDDRQTEEWIILNQLSRRNLHGPEYKVLLGEIYNRRKRGKGRPVKQLAQNDPISPQEADQITDVATDIAQNAKVSRATVIRGGKLADAVDKLADAINKRYTAGELKLSEKELLALARKSHNDQIAIDRDVRVGKKKSFAEALGIKEPKRKTIDGDACQKCGGKKWILFDTGECRCESCDHQLGAPTETPARRKKKPKTLGIADKVLTKADEAFRRLVRLLPTELYDRCKPHLDAILKILKEASA